MSSNLDSNQISWEINVDAYFFPDLIKKTFFKFYIKKRLSFTNWIDSFSNKYSNDLDWWISLPASRNPFVSDIYKIFCSTFVIKEILKKKGIDLIVENEYFYRFYLSLKEKLPKLEKKKFTVILKKKKKSNIINIVYAIFFYIIIFFLIQILKKKPKKISTIIGSFINFKSKNYTKYGNIAEKIKKKKYIYFVIHFIPEKLSKNIKFIIEKKKNFLYKENFLNFKNLIFAFSHHLRVSKFLNKKFFYKKIDFSYIFYKEISSTDQYAAKVSSILNYFFAKNLLTYYSNIKKIINWYENQIIEKGWYLGFRNFSSNIKTYGYQGYQSYAQYLNTIPSKNEFKFKVNPNNIIVPGSYHKKIKKEFFKDTPILVGPAPTHFNLDKIHLINKKINVGIALTGIKNIDQIIIDWTVYSAKILQKSNFLIKTHPILNIKYLLFEKIKNIHYFDKDLIKLNKLCFIIITTGPTSAVVDSFFLNSNIICPIIDPYDRINLNYFKSSKKIFFAKTKEEQLKKILYIQNNKLFTEKKIFNYNNFYQNLNKSNLKLFI